MKDKPITYKRMSEIELQNLHNEIETTKRDMTSEEVDILLHMFTEKFGTATWGMCLNPLFLLDTEDNPLNSINEFTELAGTKEDELVKEWREQSMLDMFDNAEIEIPNHSIEIICDKPENCNSRKLYGNSCRCIRENFANEETFFKWRDIKIKELKLDMKELLSKDEN